MREGADPQSAPRRARSRRVRLVLALGTVLLVCSAVVSGKLLFDQAHARVSGEVPEDFAQLYIVSWNARHGGPIYAELATTPELADRLGWSYRQDYYFANPPALVPLLVPISFLPYPAAWWGLVGFSVIAGVLSMFLAGRELGIARWPALLAAGFFVLTAPFMVLLLLNHIESAVLLLATLGWLALRRGRLRTGGALWGLCAAFKLFPALLLIPLLHRKLRPSFYAALVAGGLATAVGIAVIGFEELGRFVSLVIPASAAWRTSPGNFSLITVGTVLGSAAAGWIAAAAVALATAALLLRNPSPDRIWIAGTAAALLASPLSWSYYFILLGPGLLVLGTSMNLATTRGRVVAYAATFACFLWPGLLGGLARDFLPATPSWRAVNLAVPVLGLLLVLIASLRGPRYFARVPEQPPSAAVG